MSSVVFASDASLGLGALREGRGPFGLFRSKGMLFNELSGKLAHHPAKSPKQGPSSVEDRAAFQNVWLAEASALPHHLTGQAHGTMTCLTSDCWSGACT